MNVISDLYGLLLKGIKFIIAVFAAVLVLVVFSNVICRYFLDFALAWAEETARFLFIWLTFLGAILANANGEHMNFDLLVTKVPKKVGYALSAIANIIILVVLYMIVTGGIEIVKGSLEWMSSALEIPYGLVYSIVPISGVILSLQTLARIIGNLKSLFGSSKEQGTIRREL